MILVGIGGNLVAPGHADLRGGLEAAVQALAARGIPVLARSRWYRTAPVPPSGQPWFLNAVLRVDGGALSPSALLAKLHGVEEAFGRRRAERNAARTVDLDLIDMDGILRPAGEPPHLPHPRMHERAFVLLPLAEIAPSWRHPILGRSVAELIAGLPDGQPAEPVEDA